MIHENLVVICEGSRADADGDVGARPGMNHMVHVESAGLSAVSMAPSEVRVDKVPDDERWD